MGVLSWWASRSTPNPPEQPKLFKPPIVMSIVKWDSIHQETANQFLQYGWRKGELNEFTKVWDKMVINASKLLPGSTVRSLAVLLPNGLGLKAAEILSPKITELGLPTVQVLYISKTTPFEEMPVIDFLSGGITRELSDILHYIALRMESKIEAVMTDCDHGNVVVVFKSRVRNFTLLNNKERWQGAYDLAIEQTTIKKESDKP